MPNDTSISQGTKAPVCMECFGSGKVPAGFFTKKCQSCEIKRLRAALRSIEDECGCGMAPGSGAVNWQRVATRAAGYAKDALADG